MRTAYPNELYHYGVKGQKWGRRRWQNMDGSYTAAGNHRYDPQPVENPRGPQHASGGSSGRSAKSSSSGSGTAQPKKSHETAKKVLKGVAITAGLAAAGYGAYKIGSNLKRAHSVMSTAEGYKGLLEKASNEFARTKENESKLLEAAKARYASGQLTERGWAHEQERYRSNMAAATRRYNTLQNQAKQATDYVNKMSSDKKMGKYVGAINKSREVAGKVSDKLHNNTLTKTRDILKSERNINKLNKTNEALVRSSQKINDSKIKDTLQGFVRKNETKIKENNMQINLNRARADQLRNESKGAARAANAVLGAKAKASQTAAKASDAAKNSTIAKAARAIKEQRSINKQTAANARISERIATMKKSADKRGSDTFNGLINREQSRLKANTDRINQSRDRVNSYLANKKVANMVRAYNTAGEKASAAKAAAVSATESALNKLMKKVGKKAA